MSDKLVETKTYEEPEAVPHSVGKPGTNLPAYRYNVAKDLLFHTWLTTYDLSS